MKLKLTRIFKGEEYTIGKLYIDGEYFCDTMEDKVRIENCDCSQKVYGQTCIPEGIYKIEFYFWEKHNKRYPILLDVPCFSGILIHSGSSELDSSGCILVGRNTIKGKLTRSGYTWLNLMNKIRGEKNLTITIE